MAQFGMDFMYDNGSAAMWNGSANLEPMYACYKVQAAYCASHGFTYANTSATRRQFVTDEILANCLEIFADAGLDTILWLWGGAEYEWNINSRELYPVFTYFQDVIKTIDARPDVARTVKYICYAPEFDRIGTLQEMEGYLSWAYPMYRGWLDSSRNMRHVKLLAGMGSARLNNAEAKAKAQLIAQYTDIFGFSEYPLTDDGLQYELDTWEAYELLGTPILMQETNNSARMSAEIEYDESNHWGYLPYWWLAQWINHGAEVICLHRGNNSYNEYAAWFDMNGNPLGWLTDQGLVNAIQAHTRYHGYVLFEFPVEWSLGDLINARKVLMQCGLQSDASPARVTHERNDQNKTIIEGVFDPATLNSVDVGNLVGYQIGKDPATFNIAVTQFDLEDGWEASGDACRAYLASL